MAELGLKRNLAVGYCFPTLKRKQEMGAKPGSVLPTTPRTKGIAAADSFVNGRLTTYPKEGNQCLRAHSAEKLGRAKHSHSEGWRAQSFGR